MSTENVIEHEGAPLASLIAASDSDLIAVQARPTEGERGPVDQTPRDARFSAQEPVWKEEQGGRQGDCCSDTVESESGSGDQHRRKRAQQLVELQLSCRTQTWRAEQLRRRLEARPQHIKRAEECQFESCPRVGDSNSADYDVTRMCKEGAECRSRKPDPAMRKGQPDAVLMQLCEPSTRQSLDMWLEGQCSSV